MTLAVAFTIAGSDSSGGAGIQADLKTFSALGVYGASAITALTAQNTLGVQGVSPVPPEFVAAQVDSVLSDLKVGAIKTGMLANAAIIRAVAMALKHYDHIPLIADPVMVSQSGQALLEDEAIDIMKSELLPQATLVTPNMHEAAQLLGGKIAKDENEMAAQASALLALGLKAVLLKGGHAEGAKSIDVYADANQMVQLSAPRIATTNTHGTGCSLSAAIAAYMAQGVGLLEAIQKSKAWLTAALRAGYGLKLGAGQGPIHHFHALWPKVSNK